MDQEDGYGLKEPSVIHHLNNDIGYNTRLSPGLTDGLTAVEVRCQGFDSQEQERRILTDIRLVHHDWVRAAVHVKQEVLEALRKGVVVFHLSSSLEVRLAGVRG